MALPHVDIDNDQWMLDQEARIRSLLERDVRASPAKFMQDFHARFSSVMSSYTRDFMRRLADDELGRTDIAGRLKYIGGDLIILATCAKVAGTMDGRCVEYGLDCMASVMTHYEVLKKIHAALVAASVIEAA